MNLTILTIGSIIKMHDNDLYFMIYGYVDKNKKIENDTYVLSEFVTDDILEFQNSDEIFYLQYLMSSILNLKLTSIS